MEEGEEAPLFLPGHFDRPLSHLQVDVHEHTVEEDIGTTGKHKHREEVVKGVFGKVIAKQGKSKMEQMVQKVRWMGGQHNFSLVPCLIFGRSLMF